MRLGPAGDKGILANPVALKVYKFEAMRSEFRGINDMKRGITEVGFDDQFEPMKFVISTYHVEIDRTRRAKIPARDRFPFNRFRMEYNVIREWNFEEWWYMGRIVVEKIWWLR